MGIYKKASRKGLRFAYKGQCSVEDLWKLPVESLDTIYKKLMAEQKDADGDSLLKMGNRGSAILELRVDIVKDIVTTKLEEADRAKKRADNRARKQQVMEIMSRKQDAELEGKSLDELNKLLDEMGEEDED